MRWNLIDFRAISIIYYIIYIFFRRIIYIINLWLSGDIRRQLESFQPISTFFGNLWLI